MSSLFMHPACSQHHMAPRRVRGCPLQGHCRLSAWPELGDVSLGYTKGTASELEGSGQGLEPDCEERRGHVHREAEGGRGCSAVGHAAGGGPGDASVPSAFSSDTAQMRPWAPLLLQSRPFPAAPERSERPSSLLLRLPGCFMTVVS